MYNKNEKRGKGRKMLKSREKREFLFYLMRIKHKIKIQMMLSKYVQHRNYKCIHTF